MPFSVIRIDSDNFNFCVSVQTTSCRCWAECGNVGWCVRGWRVLCTHHDQFGLSTLPNDANNHDRWNVLLSDLECTISRRHHLQFQQSVSTGDKEYRTEIVSHLPSICRLKHNFIGTFVRFHQNRLANGVNATQIELFFTRLSGLVRAFTLPDQTLLTIFEILEKMGYTTEKLLREVMQPCGKMLYSCAWLNEEYPCDKLFHVSKGSEGFCCSFNYNAVKKLGKLFRVSGKWDHFSVQISATDRFALNSIR